MSLNMTFFFIEGVPNYNAPDNYMSMSMIRDVSSDDVDQVKLDEMPGFRFSWWYTGAEVIPENKFVDEDNNNQFFR